MSSGQQLYSGISSQLEQFHGQLHLANQGGINRNDAILAIAGGRVMREPFKPVSVDAIGLPRCLGQRAIKTGLVGGGGKLARCH